MYPDPMLKPLSFHQAVLFLVYQADSRHAITSRVGQLKATSVLNHLVIEVYVDHNLW